ncbi:MAG: IGHMBP2 family helicase [Bacteroidetes bacterium]|nr:MAG: IGHMBP2 family helicase [Bacteroidota bacterium]
MPLSATDQLIQLLELLAIEREEDIRQYKEMVLDRSLKERVQKGVTWYPATMRRMYLGMGDRVTIEIERTGEAKKTDVFQSGSVISLFGMLSDREVGRYSGVIAAIRPTTMRIVLGTDQFPDWLGEAVLGVDMEFDDKTYQEMVRAVNQAIRPGNKQQRLGELREVLLGDTAPESYDWVVRYEHPFLNDSQNKAVQKALQARDVAIIHGPPGTGKTTTLVYTIQEVLNHEHQVLVCAPSNTAVDLLALRCIEAGLSVLRLGNPARVEEELLRHTLDGSLTAHPDYQELKRLRRESEQLRKQAMKLRQRGGRSENRYYTLQKEARELSALAQKVEDYIVYQVLRDTQVIACTLTGAASQTLGQKRFHTVFIDEAGQALAPACWIPIARAGRVIMAGDHQQLPPTVKSIEAGRKGLAHTLFESVIERKGVDVMLEQQYRMNEQIMRFSGEQFYKGRLFADESVRDHVLGPNFTPLEWIDTSGCGFEESRHPETLSVSNPDEAQLLLRHLALLFNQIESEVPSLLENDFSVGIISPYKDQVRALNAQLAGSPMLGSYERFITVNTVDGFQGQERDVIYISLVRSNRKGEIGFLGDTRRMNVALTRARKKLVVVGDGSTLSQHPFYNAFFEYAEKAGAYRSAWELGE